MTMPQGNPTMAYKRLIDSLEEAASCARELAFQRSQRQWLTVDEKIVTMRKLVIQLAETAERNIR